MTHQENKPKEKAISSSEDAKELSAEDLENVQGGMESVGSNSVSLPSHSANPGSSGTAATTTTGTTTSETSVQSTATSAPTHLQEEIRRGAIRFPRGR